ncbi:hypothetical protein NKI15_03150 [Mesorhizobium sp. M0862]|uniref:hypothetical protein n=1 Tax=Mesorhizobium sp. M0862 TaxID=2957015 RepID=UPI0033355955
MSITVTPNTDGTVTIQCGTESITIGAQTPPKQTAAPDIPILWPAGGVTASIVAGGKARTIEVDVASANGLADAIRGQYDQYIATPEETLFQFDVKGTEPLKIGEFNKALSALGNPEWMGAQIRLTGDRNE